MAKFLSNPFQDILEKDVLDEGLELEKYQEWMINTNANQEIQTNSRTLEYRKDLKPHVLKRLKT